MKRLTVLSVFAVALAVSSLAFAEPGEGRRGGPGHGGGFAMSPFPLRSLGLSTDQWTQVRQIMAKHRSQFQTLSRQLRDARKQLNDRLVTPGALAAADVDPLVQQINQLRGQLGQEALQVALDIRGVLTPEQIAKAAEVHRRLADLRSQTQQLLRGQ